MQEVLAQLFVITSLPGIEQIEKETENWGSVVLLREEGKPITVEVLLSWRRRGRHREIIKIFFGISQKSHCQKNCHQQ